MIFRILVWIIFIVGGAVAGILGDLRLFPGFWKNWIWHTISLLIGGLLLMLVIRISRNTGKFLSQYGRKGEIPRLETNVLVTKGIYANMRHPMHLGLMIFPLSIAFILGSLTFILIIAPIEILLMLVMIFTLEEKEAIKKFGDAYLQYKKEVPAFCLRKHCLIKLLGLKTAS
jgi:protein-S-isoprenylcysteine O-methyltransferase Ste14